MKIKRLNLYTYILYIMLAAYMLGPALSFKVGVPRIDNPLTLIFVLLGFVVFFLESKHIPRKIFAMLCALTAMCIWPAIHMGITSLTPTQYMDILFFYGGSGFLLLVLPSIEARRRPFEDNSEVPRRIYIVYRRAAVCRAGHRYSVCECQR